MRVRARSLVAELGEPALLPGNRGWTWETSSASRIELRFDPPMAHVYFERGRKSEVRAFFYKDMVPQGQRRHTATLSLSGDMAVGPTTAERLGLDDPTAWPADKASWRSYPVDLSFLNAPEKPASKASSSLPRMNHPLSIICHNAVSQLFA